MNLRGVAVCMTAILFMGIATVDDVIGSWSGEQWDYDYFDSENEDFLSTGGTFGNADAQVETYIVSQGIESSQYSSEVMQYSQYYTMEGEMPIQADPLAFDISGDMPSTLYFSKRSIPYAQYQSYSMIQGANALWIQGTNSWTQYVMCPQGAWLQLVAYASSSGRGDLYEIYPAGYSDFTRNNYFSTGHNYIPFIADEVGRHILLFVTGNQASNAIIIDVVSGGWSIGTVPAYGQSRITITSSWLSGYDVYVDGEFILAENGDGACSFTVPSGNRTIKIKKGGYSYTDSKDLAPGQSYEMIVRQG